MDRFGGGVPIRVHPHASGKGVPTGHMETPFWTDELTDRHG